MSPSASVRSVSSSKSGFVPGISPNNRSSSASVGGRLYFKNSQEKQDSQTRVKSISLEQQYKLAKEYLDHGVEQVCNKCICLFYDIFIIRQDYPKN